VLFYLLILHEDVSLLVVRVGCPCRRLGSSPCAKSFPGWIRCGAPMGLYESATKLCYDLGCGDGQSSCDCQRLVDVEIPS
jgi:hypothetical protein